jgi:hypothetical protein
MADSNVKGNVPKKIMDSIETLFMTDVYNIIAQSSPKTASFLGLQFSAVFLHLSKLLNEYNFNNMKEIDMKNPNDDNNKNLLNFINSSGKYYNAINTLTDYINKCAKLHNKLLSKIPNVSDSNIENADTFGSDFKKKIDETLSKELIHIKHLIPLPDVDITISYDGTTQNKIIIVPGSADSSQCNERVDKLVDVIIKLIEKSIQNGEDDLLNFGIEYIIFSGRGNNTTMTPNETSRYIKKYEISDKKDNLSMYNIIINKDNSVNTEYMFKTEGFYMAELFVEKFVEKLGVLDRNMMTGAMNNSDNEKPHVKINEVDFKTIIDNIIPKIRIEGMALDTTANFILAPYSIQYGVKMVDNNLKVIDKSDGFNLEDILNKMYTCELHVISNDFHILRCMISCLQTLRPYPLTDKKFGSVVFHPCGTETPLMAENYFSSSYQPNFQIFFERDETPNISLRPERSMGITRNPINCRSPVELHNHYLFRLLLDHGLYSNIDRKLTQIFIDRLDTLYNVFERPSNTLEAQPANNAQPAQLANNANTNTQSQAGGYNRVKRTHKSRKNKSNKRFGGSVKKLKKKTNK